MKAIPWIVVASLLGVEYLVIYLGQRWRADAMRNIALRLGMHYLGDALPRSLSLQGTPFIHISRVWNVIDGDLHGTRVIAFDCQVGSGKGGWRRTLVAVENSDRLTNSFNPEMTVDTVDQWKILYRPKSQFGFGIFGLMPIEELKTYLNSVAGTPEPLPCPHAPDLDPL